MAVDSGVTAGTSAIDVSLLVRRGGENDQSNESRSRSGEFTSTRALEIVASIFARLRTIAASESNLSTSATPYAATLSGSNPSKASRNASRLRRIVIHESPDWNASRGESFEQFVAPVQRTPPLLVVIVAVERVAGRLDHPAAPNESVGHQPWESFDSDTVSGSSCDASALAGASAFTRTSDRSSRPSCARRESISNPRRCRAQSTSLAL